MGHLTSGHFPTALRGQDMASPGNPENLPQVSEGV